MMSEMQGNYLGKTTCLLFRNIRTFPFLDMGSRINTFVIDVECLQPSIFDSFEGNPSQAFPVNINLTSQNVFITRRPRVAFLSGTLFPSLDLVFALGEKLFSRI